MKINNIFEMYLLKSNRIHTDIVILKKDSVSAITLEINDVPFSSVFVIKIGNFIVKMADLCFFIVKLRRIICYIIYLLLNSRYNYFLLILVNSITCIHIFSSEQFFDTF